MNSPAAALYDTVKASPLAAGLDDDQARVLAGLVTSQWVQPQQVLAHEGQPDNHLYVVA
jgi:CRP-like cAMP-binding protein